VSIEGHATTRRNQRRHTASLMQNLDRFALAKRAWRRQKRTVRIGSSPALRALMRQACLRRAGKGGASFTMQSFNADMPLIHNRFYTGLVIAQPEQKKNLRMRTKHAQMSPHSRCCGLGADRAEGRTVVTQANLRLVEGISVDKTKALDAALSQIERAFGKGSIMRLGKNQKAVEIETIPTGSLGLDIALGVGGLPRGRVVEIYGPESSGKTTLTLHVIAEAQKKGGVCAFVDAEHALDPVYARKLGVNLEDLLISQPDTGEQALEITDTLVRSGAIDVLVVDSVAALTPRAEIEGEMGESQPGLQARLMSQALRKLTASISRSNTMVIFINQIRMKIGVMYGSPETTTGGNALKFYASVRLDIRRIGAIKDREEVVGNQTRVKVVKNKVAPPFKQVEFDIMYGEGVSKVGELIDLGVKAGVVEKSGAWFSFDSQRLGQGRENSKAYLKANVEIANRIEKAIRENSGIIAERILDNADPTEQDDAADA
jgi:recombination protein RecA